MIKPNSTKIVLSKETWLSAAVLGALRMAVNDPIRAHDRDRQETGNIQNDLQGAIGEIICLRYLESKNVINIRHAALDLETHVDEVDFIGEIKGRTRKFEAKCELAETYKTRFLINDRAHSKSISRQANVYIPVFTSLGSAYCIVGTGIRIKDVSEWNTKTFGRHQDPARFISLVDAAKKYFNLDGTSMKTSMLKNSESCVNKEELTSIFDLRSEMLDIVRERKIDLNNLPSDSLVKKLLKIVQTVKTYKDLSCQ